MSSKLLPKSRYTRHTFCYELHKDKSRFMAYDLVDPRYRTGIGSLAIGTSKKHVAIHQVRVFQSYHLYCRSWTEIVIPYSPTPPL
jgi:hypothetical protein